MSFTCEINFPYNWAEEFYCGERLHLSVALKCHKQLTVRGVALSVSCRSQRENHSDEYSRFIDDQDSEGVTNHTHPEESNRHKFCSEIDLFGEKDQPISMTPGTYIFDLECFLPELTIEEQPEEGNYISFKFTVVVQNIPKGEIEERTPVSALQLIMLEPTKRATFVWPGNFQHISNFSIATANISRYHVTNLEEQNNRCGYSEDSNDDDGLENWLDSVLEKPEVVEDDEGEEEDGIDDGEEDAGHENIET